MMSSQVDTSIHQALQLRESGWLHPLQFGLSVTRNRIHQLGLGRYKDIVNTHATAVNSLQVDPVESRYLLAGAVDGTVSIYDVQCESSMEDSMAGVRKHASISYADGKTPMGHKSVISSVHWYPIDTGLFVTGSYDGCINIWDTNSVQVAAQFSIPGKVFSVSMSAIASEHALVAVACEDHLIRLCDISSGGFTHTLTGHRDAVWTVHWSLTSEYVLFSGGKDGAIRSWDVRRAGCLSLFDHRNSFKNRPVHENGQRVQRGHPGTVLEKQHAPAHSSAVLSIVPSPNGRHLLSSGADSRIRLWDINSATNSLVHFECKQGRVSKPTPLAVSATGGTVYCPSDSCIQVLDINSGRLIRSLRGHFGAVNSCTINYVFHELYSSGVDGQILVWSPQEPVNVPLSPKNGNGNGASTNEDNWSDDEWMD